jgi:hypothetical protein
MLQVTEENALSFILSGEPHQRLAIALIVLLI